MSKARGTVRVDPSGLTQRSQPVLRDFAPALVAVVALVAIAVTVALTVNTMSFYYPLGEFSYVMGWTGLPLAYPLIAVVVFVLPFSQQIQQRHIFYTRVRTSIRRRLAIAALVNAIVAFVVFFLFVFLTFCFVFYIQPAMGLSHFDSFTPGSFPEDFQLARMTELLRISPLIYGLSYAAWCGANAAVWASVGFVAILTVRNRFLALAFPMILFIILGFALAILGGVFAQVSPWTLWVLFSISQVSMLPSLVTLAIFATVAAVSIVVTIARSDRLTSLQ